MESCKTCMYYERVKENGKATAVGHCKCYPPSVLFQKIPVDEKGQPIRSGLQRQAAITEIANAFFPLINEDNGCGQHKTRIVGIVD